MIKLLSAAKEELQSYCDTYFLLENFIQRYKLMFVGHKLTSFVKRETNAKGATPKNVMSMLKFLIHKIVVEFGGNIFQQIAYFETKPINQYNVFIYVVLKDLIVGGKIIKTRFSSIKKNNLIFTTWKN